MALVSICVPTYNSSKYIEECLDSITNQSFKDFEIIISDNASTDNTIEIIKSKNINNIKIYENNFNIGMAKNFNRVCSFASGKYIKLLPSDDVLHRHNLKQSLEAFENYKNISLVMTSKNLIDEKGEKIITNFSKFKTGLYEGKYVIKKILKSGRNPLGEPAFALFRKIDFENSGGFNEDFDFLLDIDLWIRLLNLGDLFYIEKCLGSFRIHLQSKSLERNIYKSYLQWIKVNSTNLSINFILKSYIYFKIYFYNFLKYLFYKIFRLK